MDLLTLAVLCGPMVDPAMTLRVIDVESAGHAFAIHDNTNGKTYEAQSSQRCGKRRRYFASRRASD